MRYLKRLAVVLVAVVIAVSLMPGASARQYYTEILDENDVDTIAAMVEKISEQTFSTTDLETVRTYIDHFLYRSKFAAVYKSKFPYTNAQGYWAGKSVNDGTYYQVVSGTGCFAYCKFVSMVIYGTPGDLRAFPEKTGRYTGEGMKEFMELYAQAGEHIRIDYKHSVTFVSSDEEGFYFMDYSGDRSAYIHLCYSTYDNFAKRCNEIYRPVFIFDADPAVNVQKTSAARMIGDKSTSEFLSSDWYTGYLAAAEKQGLIAPSNSASGMSVAETAALATKARNTFVENGVHSDLCAAEVYCAPFLGILNEGKVCSVHTPAQNNAVDEIALLSLADVAGYLSRSETMFLPELPAAGE